MFYSENFTSLEKNYVRQAQVIQGELTIAVVHDFRYFC